MVSITIIIKEEEVMTLRGSREDLGRVEERREEGEKDVNTM